MGPLVQCRGAPPWLALEAELINLADYDDLSTSAQGPAGYAFETAVDRFIDSWESTAERRPNIINI